MYYLLLHRSFGVLKSSHIPRIYPSSLTHIILLLYICMEHINSETTSGEPRKIQLLRKLLLWGKTSFPRIIFCWFIIYNILQLKFMVIAECCDTFVFSCSTCISEINFLILWYTTMTRVALTMSTA